MEKTLHISNREVTLFWSENITKKVPVVVLNTVQGEGRQVYEACRKQVQSDFILAAIDIKDWKHDMSPWAIPPIAKHDTACTGGADDYVKLLSDRILPEIRECIPAEASYYAIAGYSLGGLFALYALYQTDLFSCMASASGSFWFPDFVEYAANHKFAGEVDSLYFSLGKRESRTRNPVLSKVEENTKWLVEYYQREGYSVYYEENEGNHFQQAVWRMAKGIVYLLRKKI